MAGGRKGLFMEPGIYENGGIEILSRRGTLVSEAVYTVRYFCCNSTVDVKQLAVKRRVNAEAPRPCPTCSRRKAMYDLAQTPKGRRATPWTEQEDDFLRRSVASGLSFRSMAIESRRSAATLQRRARDLGLKRDRAERKRVTREIQSKSAKQFAAEKRLRSAREKLRQRSPKPALLWLQAMIQTNRKSA